MATFLKSTWLETGAEGAEASPRAGWAERRKRGRARAEEENIVFIGDRDGKMRLLTLLLNSSDLISQSTFFFYF